MRSCSTLVIFTALAGLAAPACAQDFNGDGLGDLAIGAPNEDLGAANCGAVFVIYGAGPGLGLDAFFPLPAAIFSQTASGIEVDEAGDGFGSALAWGDFNGDGFDDLAIGIPGEDVGVLVDAGAVAVLYGSPGGLFLGGPPFIVQGMLPGGEVPEAGDRFGAALAAGDFDGNFFSDLAIGVPGEDVGALVDAGLVNVHHGAPPGIFPGAPAPFPIFVQGIIGLDPTEPGDQFGNALTACDFDMSMSDDLAIGSAFEDIGAAVDTGSVTVVYSVFAVGLTVNPLNQVWHQNSPGIADACQAGDHFGWSLASADFDGRVCDLAIGVPDEDIGANIDTGCVHVIYGTVPGGLNAFGPVPAQYFHQNSPAVPSNNANNDRFGASLATGAFDGPGTSGVLEWDLAIGLPGNSIAGVNAGAAIVIYGAGPGVGLNPAGPTLAEIWHQNSGGIPGTNGIGDGIGSSLTAADYDGNGADDLVMGVPFEDNGAVDAGCVNVIYGVPLVAIGLDPALAVIAELWHQNTPGIPDGNEAGDNFGAALDLK